jgi:hypothetical protein
MFKIDGVDVLSMMPNGIVMMMWLNFCETWEENLAILTKLRTKREGSHLWGKII